MAIALLDDARAQRAALRGWSAATLPPPAPRAPALVSRRGTRLRVGYLSSDFHDHATAHLTAGLFEHHDRARIETFAYAADRRRRQRDAPALARGVRALARRANRWRTPPRQHASATTRSTSWSTSRATRTGRALAHPRRASGARAASLPRLSRHDRVRGDRRLRRRRHRRAARRGRRIRGAAAAPAALLSGERRSPRAARRRRDRAAVGLAGAGARARVLQPDLQARGAVRRLWMEALRAHRDAVLWLARAARARAKRTCTRVREQAGVARARRVRAGRAAGGAHRAPALRRPRARRAALRLAHDGQRRALRRRAAAHLPRDDVRGARGASLCTRGGIAGARGRIAGGVRARCCDALCARSRAAARTTAQHLETRRARARAVRHRRRSRAPSSACSRPRRTAVRRARPCAARSARSCSRRDPRRTRSPSCRP